MKIKAELGFLINTSLFFLDKEKITTTINKYDFISSIQLKKKYPNTLRIIIIEKIPIATQIIGKKKFYITKENNKINFTDIKVYENLPLIFGNYKNFNFFYNDLEKSNFNINKIKAFYYFDIGRWDIILKNGIVIKLPHINYIEGTNNFISIYNKEEFSKFKVFDYRIKDQLILK